MSNRPMLDGVHCNSQLTPPDDFTDREDDLFLDEPEPLRTLALDYFYEGWDAEDSLRKAREQYAEESGD